MVDGFANTVLLRPSLHRYRALDCLHAVEIKEQIAPLREEVKRAVAASSREIVSAHVAQSVQVR